MSPDLTLRKCPQRNSPGSFYRYHDMFGRSTQAAAFVVVMAYWLANDTVPDRDAVAEQLGSKQRPAHHQSSNRLKPSFPSLQSPNFQTA